MSEYYMGLYLSLLSTCNQWEAIRQTVNCPTCDGLRISQIAKPPRPGAQAISATHLACPDCTDGKIPMLRLLAVGAAVFAPDLAATPWPDANRIIRQLRAVQP